jgi:hypothetical protein
MNVKTYMVAAVTGVAIALAVCAGAQPGEPPATGPGPRGGYRPPDARPPLGMRRGTEPTTQQVHDAEAFVSMHSPNHFKLYERSIGRPIHPRMEAAIVQGLIELQAMEAADLELYKMKLDQIEVQDKIFGITDAQRESGRAVDRKSLREQLRPQEQKLIELRKAEAHHRLERMAEALEKEKTRLANLEQMGSTGVDLLIDQDIDRIGRGFFGGFGGRGYPPMGPSPATGPSR